MKLLRLSLVASIVAALCTFGLVVNSGPAQAATVPWPALTGPINARNAQVVGTWATRTVMSGGTDAAATRVLGKGCKSPWTCAAALGGFLAIWGLAETSDTWWPLLADLLPEGLG